MTDACNHLLMSGIESGIGTDIVAWFQGLGSPVIGYILSPLHFIGGQYGYLVLLPVVYWSISKYHGKRLMILSLGTSLVSQYLKLIFARPRPFQVSPDRISPTFEQTGYGIPSGHTIFATAISGYAWYRFPKNWIRILGVAFVLLTGISRMVHGLHFPQDVIIGLILGLGMVVLFWWLDTRFSERMAGWSVPRKLLIIVTIAVLGFILALIVEHDYEERKDILSVIGALLGGLSGLALEHRFVHFSSGGKVGTKILRTLVGLVLTVGIFVGLDVLYDVVVRDATGVGALVIYVVRYGLVALFGTVGAPYLFVRFRLAETET
jgi:membrane-associated phospholipid phosphatase